MNTLIILRGPSGAGKSTVAQLLQKQSTHQTVIVEQDHYRHTLLQNQPDSKSIIPKMVLGQTIIALEAGYNVIIEGIFNKKKYLSMFQQLVQKFPDQAYLYYFDIPFAETATRHTTRKKSALFSAADMQNWYSFASPLDLPGEQHITPAMSAQETAKSILRHTNL